MIRELVSSQEDMDLGFPIEIRVGKKHIRLDENSKTSGSGEQKFES